MTQLPDYCTSHEAPLSLRLVGKCQSEPAMVHACIKMFLQYFFFILHYPQTYQTTENRWSWSTVLLNNTCTCFLSRLSLFSLNSQQENRKGVVKVSRWVSTSLVWTCSSAVTPPNHKRTTCSTRRNSHPNRLISMSADEKQTGNKKKTPEYS